MKRISVLVFSLLLCTSLIPYKAFAGFPIGKYRSLVVPSFSYYHQTDRFDASGKIIKGASGTGFSSYASSLYLGYGISRRLDFVANIPYYYQVNKQTPTSMLTNQGLGDVTVGLAYNLINFNYVRYLSVQVSGIVPLYNTVNNYSALGIGSPGSEVKLMYMGNLPKSIAGKGYFNLELMYRKYFDYQGPDQVSIDGTVGYPVSKHNQINLEVLYFRSISANKTFTGNIYAARDFSYFKPALNFGHQFTRRCSLFIGGFYVPFGTNTGVGYGGSALLVFKL